MLGHCRSTDRQLLGQFADRARVSSEQLEDRTPRRVAKEPEASISVSTHER
jgi:hypothetical protein